MVVAQDLVVGRLTYPPQAGSGAFFFFFGKVKPIYVGGFMVGQPQPQAVGSV